MGTTEPGGNSRLRAARQALGLRSQNQLAEAVTRSAGQIGLRNVSITERTVRRWESDNPPWPQPDHQAALEHLFSRPVTELGFTPPWASEEAVPQQSERAASPGTGSSGGGAAGMFPMRVLADPLPGSIAADFITITSAYRHMYWTVPPAHLRDAVATHVRLGIMLVASVPEAARRPLAAAISESKSPCLPDRVLRHAEPARSTAEPCRRAPGGAGRARFPSRRGSPGAHGVHSCVFRGFAACRRSQGQDTGGSDIRAQSISRTGNAGVA